MHSNQVRIPTDSAFERSAGAFGRPGLSRLREASRSAAGFHL